MCDASLIGFVRYGGAGGGLARGEHVETQYTTFIAQLFSAIYDEFPSYKERGGGGSDIGPYDVS